MFRFIFLFILITLTGLNNASLAKIDDTLSANTTQNFEEFLMEIRRKAAKQGVSKATLELVFNDLTPNPKVLKFDRNQAEFTLNFWRYINSRVSNNRLEKGKLKLEETRPLLGRVYEKYGVPPSLLVAFWGLETNYGKYVGKMNLVRALATLSFDLRRRDFFTKELLILLKLIDQGKLPHNAQGSWAGAMGNTQFMPSNVAAYGVDADKNGKLDLWGSHEDIFYSSANFLKRIGWHKGERWGREVILPQNFDFSLAGLKTKKTLKKWLALGVKSANSKAFARLSPSLLSFKASLVLPMGHKGPAFLVYRNFHAILRWNRSILYALSVGYLSDRLNGGSKLVAKFVDEPSLSRDDVLMIQSTLNKLGFDAGKPDGILGSKTRNAIRDYQHANNLVIDGYMGYQLLQMLKKQNEH